VLVVELVEVGQRGYRLLVSVIVLSPIRTGSIAVAITIKGIQIEPWRSGKIQICQKTLVAWVCNCFKVIGSNEADLLWVHVLEGLV
jgi:hypothetical protein